MAKAGNKKGKKDGMHTAVVSTPSVAPSTKATTKNDAPKPSLKSQVENYIREAGTDGCTVNQIAEGLNLVNKDTDKVEAAKVMKKLRVQARSVCGGAASSRSGRQAIYILPN
tara:strand:+ start:3042 stop:3377 length:336 start_codon:yes stop_codon:yes gene_type:complete